MGRVVVAKMEPSNVFSELWRFYTLYIMRNKQRNDWPVLLAVPRSPNPSTSSTQDAWRTVHSFFGARFPTIKPTVAESSQSTRPTFCFVEHSQPITKLPPNKNNSILFNFNAFQSYSPNCAIYRKTTKSYYLFHFLPIPPSLFLQP